MNEGREGLILQAIGVHKVYYNGEEKLHVLQGVDLEVRKGEIVAIVGPSGTGKSTLLHILGALDRPTEGKVFLDSVELFSYTDKELAFLRNKTIGFVFQFHHLLPEFTALENVMMPGLIGGDNYQLVREKAEYFLKEVGLKERIAHIPSELSAGECQRVAVARALLNNPKIVLADEPSGNLDRATAESLHDLLWDLSRAKALSLLIVTHNQELAQRADRIVKLRDGKAWEVTSVYEQKEQR